MLNGKGQNDRYIPATNLTYFTIPELMCRLSIQVITFYARPKTMITSLRLIYISLHL